MIAYVPERIYEKIKDLQEYKDIDARVTAIKARCQTLKDWVYSDDESFYGEDGVKCQKDLEALVQAKCPEYLVQYKVNSKEFTKEDLLDMYKSKKYDEETNFFILSAIIDFSYEDGTYAYFLDEIVEYYNSLSEEVKVTLSNYVHFKYMYAKCYTLALHSTVFYDKYYINLFNKQYSVYQKALEYTKDSDTGNNYILEALADSVQVLGLNRAPEDTVFEYLKLIYQLAENLQFQYENYSAAYIKIMDLMNDMYLYYRELTDFVNQSLIIYKYISSAMASPSKLYKGLNYYDKCNHGMFAISVYKYLKLKDLVPIFRVSREALVRNLSVEDYEFIHNYNQSSTNNSMVLKYKESVDGWLDTSKNIGLGIVCQIN